MPLFRYTQYTCLIQDGSGSLLWTISGFGSQNVSFLFSSSHSVGRSFSSQGFGASLTGKTNGIQSVIGFTVTEDHNATTIFCKDNDPSDKNISQCAVNILGMDIGLINNYYYC